MPSATPDRPTTAGPIASRQNPVVDSDIGVELWLPAEATAARQARHYIQERWAQLSENMLDDIVLIVTELVSNAVRHGAPEITLRLRVEPFAVDIAVLDHGTEMPPETIVAVPHTATSGRGLAIIDQLANAWGVQPLDERLGKAVWVSITSD